jgi:hypothetical protein
VALNDFRLVRPDAQYCVAEYEQDGRTGWNWTDEHGELCDADGWGEDFRRRFMQELDGFVRDIPIVGTVFKWAQIAASRLSQSSAKVRRQNRLRAAWADARASACERATDLRVVEEVAFLARSGFGELVSFVSEPAWLGFDSRMAADARNQVFPHACEPESVCGRQRRAPFWPALPVFGPGSRGRFIAGRWEHVPAPESVNFAQFMARGGGLGFLAAAASGQLRPTGWQRPFAMAAKPYYGPRHALPELPRELDAQIEELCSTHLPFDPGQWDIANAREMARRVEAARRRARAGCLLCVKGSLRTAMIFRMYGKPLGDIAGAFRRIEQIYAPEIAYLRGRGKEVQAVDREMLVGGREFDACGHLDAGSPAGRACVVVSRVFDSAMRAAEARGDLAEPARKTNRTPADVAQVKLRGRTRNALAVLQQVLESIAVRHISGREWGPQQTADAAWLEARDAQRPNAAPLHRDVWDRVAGPAMRAVVGHLKAGTVPTVPGKVGAKDSGGGGMLLLAAAAAFLMTRK